MKFSHIVFLATAALAVPAPKTASTTCNRISGTIADPPVESGIPKNYGNLAPGVYYCEGGGDALAALCVEDGVGREGAPAAGVLDADVQRRGDGVLAG